MLKNDNTKQLFWKLTIVKELLTGIDGKVRVVIVEITDSSNTSKQLMCSIQHVIPTEVNAEESDDYHQKKDPLRLDNVELQQLQDNFSVDSKTIRVCKHLNIY